MAVEVIEVKYSATSTVKSIVEDFDKQRMDAEKRAKADITVHEVRELLGSIRDTESSYKILQQELLRAERGLRIETRKAKAWRVMALVTGGLIMAQFILYGTGVIPPLFKVLGWM